jgi:hypothetical protein
MNPNHVTHYTIIPKTASCGGGTNIQRSVCVSSRAWVDSHGEKQKKGGSSLAISDFFLFSGVKNASKKSKYETPKTILRSL